MKYGIRIPTFAPRFAARSAPITLDEMGAYLRRAEDLNFEATFVLDHLLIAKDLYSCTWFEPISLLSALAGVTRTIGLGTSVTVLPLHRPVLFAKQWATMDYLSGGRSILGVGVGWHENEFECMGVPRTERGRRTTEILEALELLWAEDDVAFDGKYFQFKDVTIEPKPIQQPRPPIWIGGGTSPTQHAGSDGKGFGYWAGQPGQSISPVLDRIARFADVWIAPSYGEPEDMKSDREKIAELMVKHGRDPSQLSRAYGSWIYVLKPGEKPESAIPAYSQFSGRSVEFWQEHYLLGERDELVDRIGERIEALGGIEWLLLNPLDWDHKQLEYLATEVFAQLA